MKFFWQKTKSDEPQAASQTTTRATNVKSSGHVTEAEPQKAFPYPVSRSSDALQQRVKSSLTAAESHEMLSVVGRQRVRHTALLHQEREFSVAYDTETFDLLMRWHKSCEAGWFAVPPLFHQAIIERLQDFRETPQLPKSLKTLFDVAPDTV